MNTPPKTRRYDKNAQDEAAKSSKGGSYFYGIADPDAAVHFANFVTTFVHLEQAMEAVLEKLLGVGNQSASLIMRSINSNKGRIAVMKALLQRAGHNITKPEEYDQIISEFEAINTIRNHYVHGDWTTSTEDGSLMLIRPNGDPYLIGHPVAKRVSPDDIKRDAERIERLWTRMDQLIVPVYPAPSPSNRT